MAEDQDFDGADHEDNEDELDEVPEDDNAELAALLGVIEQDLIREIGGPWSRVRYDEVHQAAGDVSYLGRAGASVVLSFDSASRQITVGKTEGKWPGPGTIVWLVQEPMQTMTLERDGLEGLAAAVDAAAAAKAAGPRHLPFLRRCGRTGVRLRRRMLLRLRLPLLRRRVLTPLQPEPTPDAAYPAGMAEPGAVAVIFTSTRTEVDDAGYAAAVVAMEALAAQQHGFLALESVRDPVTREGITVSYWRDEEAARTWKQVREHQLVQRMGRTTWYSHYGVVLAHVTRSYDSEAGEGGP